LKSEDDTTMTGGPPEYYSIGHYGMEIWEVYHFQGVTW
jgi:hypothetical protein